MIKQLQTTWVFKIALIKRLWVINPFLYVIAFMLIYLFCELGFWQLERADEKTKLITQFELQQKAEPVELDGYSPESIKDYQPVIAKGTWINKMIVYMANQSYKGRDGYHVYIPIHLLERKNIVWLNLGWIQAKPDRRELPEIPSISDDVLLTGHAYYSKGSPLLFDKALIKIEPNQWLLQGRDYSLLNSVLQKRKTEALPFIIRVSQNSDNGFKQDWRMNTMSPNKHLAYAFQWFGLALAVVIVLVLLSFKKERQ